MSLYIDTKFVSLVGTKLERFSRKSEYLWNFRCPMCGDSYKNKFKARGYIYRQKSNLFFACHNCGASTSLGNFLKAVDNSLYREYQMERFKCESAGNVAKPDFSAVQVKPIFNNRTKINLPKISELHDDHFAKQYVKKRAIPQDYWSTLYYASDFAGFVREVLPDYEREIKSDERIVIPFYDEKKELLGFQGRALGSSKIKYITIKTNDDNRKIFGLDRLDKSKTVYVVEGPIDSMFLQNSVAMMDAALYNVVPLLGDLDYVFVFDNEPRNPEVCRHIEKTINMNKKVCIWPSRIDQKDINDMVLSGKLTSEIQSIIDTNTFEELKARLEFLQWKKI